MSTKTLPRQGVPLTALILGSSGLVPFAVPTGVILLGPHSWQETAWSSLHHYAAVILSFLGAVHWGSALRDAATLPEELMSLSRSLSWSVVPALWAWLTLFLPHPSGIALLSAGFAVQYWADARATKAGRLPDWYLSLRRWLTTGVLICLVLAVSAVL